MYKLKDEMNREYQISLMCADGEMVRVIGLERFIILYVLLSRNCM